MSACSLLLVSEATHRGTPAKAFSNLSGSFFSLIPMEAMSVTFRISTSLIHPGNALQALPVVCR